ncbi:MAG: methionine synthase, partial [Chlorobi bacterium]|nr:methionine synthase [Chlorobiota bacterium]
AKAAAAEYTAKNTDKPRFVAGSIGPTNQTASMSADINNPGARRAIFDDFYEAYYDQIKGLADGGADLLLIETITDALNCKAALKAYSDLTDIDEEKYGLPIMISVTIIDKSGRTLAGQTLEAFQIAVGHTKNLLSIGLNCSLGPKEMRPFIRNISEIAPEFISLYPNAGLPNEFGDYDESPENMARILEEYVQDGFLNIIGGCCGTTPDHIKALVEVAERNQPRQIPIIENKLRLSGLEPLIFNEENNFINIGERTNVAGSRKFARLITNADFEQALTVARSQTENGASIIDINLDEAMLDSQKEMTTFLNYCASEPDIVKVPIMIDSSDFKVIEAGLKCLQGKGIVNSVSLKEGEDVFKKQVRLIMKYGAAIVVMAFDESGQAAAKDDKTRILSRAYKILTEEIGFPAEDIIVDPNVLTVATGMPEHNAYAADFIETCRELKKRFPEIKISGGISNVSFAFRGNNKVREAMHSVFLYHAVKAGLDMGIVNAGQLEIYENIDKDLLKVVEDVILNKSESASDALIDFAEKMNKIDSVMPGDHKGIAPTEERNISADERLKKSLIKGDISNLDIDMKEAVAMFSNPMDIIDGPLGEGMKHVGELFGAGKMFLPQVVKSARVMKKAVSILTPMIEEQLAAEAISKKRPLILIATVKGDVHDIGKNIVSVVLACNNYEIVDLGVSVQAEKIVDEAIHLNADAVGLSGLITPSLEEMRNV